MKEWLRIKHPDRVLFAVAVLLVVFVCGMAVAQFRVFPYSIVRSGAKSAQDLQRNWQSYIAEEPTKFLEPARYDGDGVTLHDRQRADAGLTFMTGLFEQQPSAQMIDMEGAVVHRWVPDFEEIWHGSDADLSKYQIPFNSWDMHIHGALPLPDGSAVFNYNQLLIKLGKCSELQWILPYKTHHSVFRSEDGTFWFPSLDYVRERRDSLPKKTKPPYRMEFALQLSASGEVLQKISLDDILIENGLEALLFPTGTEDVTNTSADFTHLNDIEVLQSADAESFPLFEAGDVMASYRNHNLVFVFDPESRKVKWYQIGPWLRQHDPDFEADGTLLVFNNRRDQTKSGSVFGGSSIMSHDPVTGRTRLLYQQTPETPFYTDIMGKQERTPNGNILITEAKSGRLFEIDENGDVVWEFINRYDADRVVQLEEALRLSHDYFSVEDWSCD